MLMKKKLKRPAIPFSFLIHHSYKKMKEKKWRMMMCDMVMSLSLIGVGAAISLTSSISTNIKKAYGDILGEDRICIDKKKTKNEQYGLYSCSEEEVEKISEIMSDYVFDYGVNYYLDYENFCTNESPISFYDSIKEDEFVIDSISFQDINEYVWIEDASINDIYPSPLKTIKKNEVVLGLDITTIRDICYGLRIERTVTSLSGYLTYNELVMVLNFENVDWGYMKSFPFIVKGFILEKENHIYHSDHLWNKYVYEDLLNFPPTNYISGFSKYPWDLRKIHYLKMYERNCDSFLVNAFNNIDLYGYVFEIANKTYYEKLLKNKEVNDTNRLLVFLDYREGIDTKITPYIESACPHLSNPIYSSYGGYSIYPSSFMSGFSKPTYFSYSEEKIDEAISIVGHSDEIGKIDALPDGVLTGYFANNDLENVSYLPLNSYITNGLNIDDVIISKGMAENIFHTQEVVGQEICLTFNSREIPVSENKTRKEYINTYLTIKGISNENKNIIHHRSDWSILFFQCRLGVSIFSLSPFSISFMVDHKKNMESSIAMGNKLFGDLDFYNPMSDFNLGVDEICGFIQIALLIFSIVSIVVSILLLSTCSYLHVIENKKDIGLARCLGFNKKEAAKFVFSYSLLTASISFFLSSIELVGFTIFSMFAISEILGSNAIFTFNPLAILLMFAITFIVAILSSAIFSQKITKMNPLEAIK